MVVVSGDGAFGFNAMELDTCRRHGARTVFVVANNEGWNIERMNQERSYEGRIVGVELRGSDYAGLARALGLYAERITSEEALPGAFQRAFDHAPSLLDVAVTREAPSPDFLSGLASVPDYQALTKWDALERARLPHPGPHP